MRSFTKFRRLLMAILLVAEDGSGKADSNSYVTVEFADGYHEASLYPNWPEDEEQKKKALISATRILDGLWRWNGFKGSREQALQWPRRECPDPNQEKGGEPAYVA